MDYDIILSKLESLGRCIARIEEKRPDSSSLLLQDYDLQDIISLNLERAVQTSVDIASYLIADMDGKPLATMGESFIMIVESGIITRDLGEKLRKAVGFRNISVHAYKKIDWDILYTIIKKNLNDFRDFAEAVMTYIEK